jgi:hypothetical protein
MMPYELTDEIPKLPCPLVDDPKFVYVPSASTDITKTWRKFGWKPLSETLQTA